MSERHPIGHGPLRPHARHRHGIPGLPDEPPFRWPVGKMLSWAAILCAAGALLWRAAAPRAPRMLALAIEADDAARLCQKPACALDDFWDRAAAAGVQAVVLRERPLKDLAERGEVLHVARGEFEKWRALGLVAPGAILKPDTIWIKDPLVLKQVQEAAMRQGMIVSTAASAGFVMAQFPAGYANVEDSLGAYDAETLASLEGRSLAAVYSDNWDGRLGPVGLRWQGGKVEGVGGAAGDWTLAPKTVDATAGAPTLFRAALGQPSRLLILRLPAGQDVDAALALLRQAREELTDAGVAPGLPSQTPEKPAAADHPWLIIAALWLAGLCGPLLAARAGLTVLKRAGALARREFPVLSPILQLAVGLIAQAAAAAALGMIARACLERLLLAEPGLVWMRACVVVPVIVGLLTLYSIDGEGCRKALAAPLTNGRALAALVLAGAAVLILDPRWLLIKAGVWPALRAAEAFSGPLWWLAWRWREALVGVPCLLQAMFLIDWRLECPDCAGIPKGVLADARTWFLPGLLAPAGVVAALARRGLPLGLALAQTAGALGLGALAGAVLIAARMRLAHRAKDPEHDRSIVLDGRV